MSRATWESGEDAERVPRLIPLEDDPQPAQKERPEEEPSDL